MGKYFLKSWHRLNDLPREEKGRVVRQKNSKKRMVQMEVITIANNKGGVGKTMNAYQLICHLANQGHKVLAIDLDSQANLSSTFGIQIQRTLIPEWLIGDVPLEEVWVGSEGKEEFHHNISLIRRVAIWPISLNC